jgi:hypothetical protein
MSVDQRFSRHEAHLSPDDLRLAAEAFDKALLSVQEVADDLPPYRARQLLARYVMERALRGDRDPVQLRQYALERLRRVTSSVASPRQVLDGALREHGFVSPGSSLGNSR